MQQWVPLGCRYCPRRHCTCFFSFLRGLEGSLPFKATWGTCRVYGTGVISTDSFVNTQTNVRITCKYRGRGRGGREREGERKRERNKVRKRHIPLQTAQLTSALQIKSSYNSEFHWPDQFWYLDPPLPLLHCRGDYLQKTKPKTTTKPLNKPKPTPGTPVICVTNMPSTVSGCILNNVQFIHGMPWKSCSLQGSYSRVKECSY